MPSEVLDVNGAAGRVGLSPSTLDKYRIYGGGPRFLKLGRSVRYRTEDLDAWLADRVRTSTSDAPTPEPTGWAAVHGARR